MRGQFLSKAKRLFFILNLFFNTRLIAQNLIYSDKEGNSLSIIDKKWVSFSFELIDGFGESNIFGSANFVQRGNEILIKTKILPFDIYKKVKIDSLKNHSDNFILHVRNRSDSAINSLVFRLIYKNGKTVITQSLENRLIIPNKEVKRVLCIEIFSVESESVLIYPLENYTFKIILNSKRSKVLYHCKFSAIFRNDSTLYVDFGNVKKELFLLR